MHVSLEQKAALAESIPSFHTVLALPPESGVMEGEGGGRDGREREEGGDSHRLLPHEDSAPSHGLLLTLFSAWRKSWHSDQTV